VFGFGSRSSSRQVLHGCVLVPLCQAGRLFWLFKGLSLVSFSYFSRSAAAFGRGRVLEVFGDTGSNRSAGLCGSLRCIRLGSGWHLGVACSANSSGKERKAPGVRVEGGMGRPKDSVENQPSDSIILVGRMDMAGWGSVKEQESMGAGEERGKHAVEWERGEEGLTAGA